MIMNRKLLRFTASWCQPCKMLAKTLEGITIDYPIEVIDIDEKQDLAIQYGVRGVPTLVMLQDDVETKRIVGMQTEGFLKDWLV
jgi:thioredoxin 1